MQTELVVADGEVQQQQQQSAKQDLSEKYRTIGIPAVTAAAMFNKDKAQPRQQTAAYDYED